MKKLGISDIDNNLERLFKSNLGNRNANLFNMLKLVDNIDENMVLAIDGKWGTGKTVFVKQFEYLLNNYKASENEIKLNYFSKKDSQYEMKNNFITVYYDAWKNDDHENPLESLLYNIAKNFGEEKSVAHKTWSEKLIKLIECVSLPQLGPIKDLKNAVSGVDILENFKQKEQLKELLKKALDELFSEDKKRMIVFIDELDRCRPTYAIKLLEKIKHLFDDPRIVFVFSTNLGQLENTVKKYYGENFSAYEYLDKIFDLRLGLNKIEVEEYMRFLLLGNNLFSDIGYATAIAKKFNFGLRGCERYVMQFKILKKYLNQNIEAPFAREDGKYSISFFIPILLALKLKDIKTYNKFIQGESCEKFKTFVESDKNIENQLKWMLAKQPGQKINESDIEIFYKSTFNDMYIVRNETLHFNNFKKTIINIMSLLNSSSDYEV